MFERSQYMTGYYPVTDPEGTPRLLVVVKRTYSIDTVEARCNVADEQDDLVLGDEYTGDEDPFKSSIRYEADISPWKVKKDVVFLGKAYAPGGKPAPEWDCTLRVGGYSRTVRIFGPRKVTWVPPGKAKKDRPPEPQPPVISEPEPIESVELIYENAYGGMGTYYPEHPGAFRKAVRKAKKKQQKEQEEEAAKAAAAAEAEEAAAEEKAAAEAEAQKERDIRGYFFHGVKDIADAPEEELEIEIGSRKLKAKDGTMVLDLAELWEAEERDAEEERKALEAAAKEAAEAAKKDHDGTLRADAEQMAREAAELTEEHLEERREYEARLLAERRENGARAILRAEEGDEVLADDGWIEVQKRERERFYESLGLDPDEEVVWEDGEFPRIPCPTNFVGKGFALRNCQESLDGLEMPLIEDPNRLLKPEDIPVDPAMLHLPVIPQPAGFGFVHRAWSPRSGLAGYLPTEMEEQQLRQDKELVGLDPDNPDDLPLIQAIMDRTPQPLDPMVNNGATARWQVEQLDGDEDVFLENLDAAGKTFFKLPGAVPYTRLNRGEGWERVDVVLDTLVIDREAEKLWLVWRGTLPFGGLDELSKYPGVDIDVQDMGLTEWRELLEREAIERRRKAGEALKLGEDEISEEESAEFDERIRKAGVGLHGVHETRSTDAREVRADDGAIVDIQDREDVILNDDGWIEQARLDAMTDDERREWELAQDEKKAVADKKRKMKERVEEIERQKALEAEEEAKKKKKKKQKAEAPPDDEDDEEDDLEASESDSDDASE